MEEGRELKQAMIPINARIISVRGTAVSDGQREWTSGGLLHEWLEVVRIVITEVAYTLQPNPALADCSWRQNFPLPSSFNSHSPTQFKRRAGLLPVIGRYLHNAPPSLPKSNLCTAAPFGAT